MYCRLVGPEMRKPSPPTSLITSPIRSATESGVPTSSTELMLQLAAASRRVRPSEFFKKSDRVLR